MASTYGGQTNKGSWIFSAFLIAATSSYYLVNEEVRSLHDTLSLFRTKGQLTVEVFPPLSLWLPTVIPVTTLTLVGISCRLIAIVCLINWRTRHRLPGSLSQLVLAVIACICWVMFVYFHESDYLGSLQASSSVGELGIVVSVVMASRPISTDAIWSAIAPTYLVVSLALGCNLGDFCSSFLIVYLGGLQGFLKSRWSNRQTPVS